jgi:hypothetical protein
MDWTMDWMDGRALVVDTLAFCFLLIFAPRGLDFFSVLT